MNIHICVKPALEHDRFPMTWEGESFSLRLMRLSRRASQNLPSVAEVKNECSYMPKLPFAFLALTETDWAEIIALWSSVVTYDPNGRFQISLYLLHNLWIWTLLGVLVYFAERRDWVEEGACSRFVFGVISTIVCSFLIYIYRELNGFTFQQYSTHSNLFIKLFYCIFCKVHAM